jgi:hypothetical protein
MRSALRIAQSLADNSIMTGPGRWRFGYGTSWAHGAVLAGLLIILAVTGYFFNQSIKREQEGSLAESEAIARSMAAFVQAKELDYLNNLQAYAGRFRFREAVQRRDRAEALVHLRQLLLPPHVQGGRRSQKLDSQK